MIIKGYTCSHFDTKDIAFARKEMDDGDGILGTSSFEGLGMACSLEVDVHNESPITIKLHLANGQWKANLKFTRFNEHITNVSLAECKTDFVFDPSSIRINGMKRVSRALVQALYTIMAPMIGPKIVDPMMCASLGMLAETMNVVVQVVRTFSSSVKPPMHIWPDVHILERMVKPKLTNSTLVLAPYDHALVFRAISRTVNGLLGEPSVASKVWKPDLVLNKVIRERIAMNDKGDIDVTLSNVEIAYEMLGIPLHLRIDRFRLTNTATFKVFELIKPVSTFTLSNSFVLEGPLEADIDMTLYFDIVEDAAPNQNGNSSTRRVEAPFKVSGASLQGLHMNIWLLFALDAHALLGLNLDHVMSCLLTSIAALELPRLVVEAASVTMPRFAMFENDKHADPLPLLFQSFMDAYVTPFASGFTQHDMDHALRAFAWYGAPMISTLLRFVNSCPLPPQGTFPPQVPQDGFVRMDAFPIRQLAFIINNFMAPPDDVDFSISRILALVADALSKGKTSSGDASLPIVDFKPKRLDGVLSIFESVNLGPFSLLKMFPSLQDDDTSEEPSFAISVGNLTVGPLNDVDWTKLFAHDDSKGHYSLINALRMNDRKRLQMSVDVRLSLKAMLKNGKSMSPAFTITMSMSSLAIAANVFMRMAPGALRHLNFTQIMSPCFAFAFPRNDTFKIEDLGLKFDGLRFRVTCQEGPCKLPFTQRFTDFISTHQANKEMQQFMLHAVESVTKVLSGEDRSYFEGLNVPLGTDNVIASLQDKCEGIVHPKPKPVSAPKWIPPMQYFMLLSALGLVLQFAVYMLMVQRNHRRIRLRQSSRILQSPLLSVVEGASPMTADETVGEDDVTDILPGGSRGDLQMVERSPLAILLNRRVAPAHVRAMLFGLVGAEDRTGENTADALYLLGLSKPLVRHPGIHPIARYGVALLLLVNFCIFVAGVSFFTMGTITIVATFGEEALKPIPMMTLTLDTCIDMMVEGRALLFALFIGVSSGVFPWARVALMGFVWLAPPTILPV